MTDLPPLEEFESRDRQGLWLKHIQIEEDARLAEIFKHAACFHCEDIESGDHLRRLVQIEMIAKGWLEELENEN